MEWATVGYPPGSNRTLIGQWYGFDGVPWCAETVSYGLYNAGFNDGAGHITLAEPTTDRGWAYVPFLETAFRDAGAFDQNSRVGDAVIFDWNADGLGDHTGLVESINDDGTLNTLEGNVDSQLKRERRGPGPVRGFCHPPYSGDSPPPPDHPRWPGRLVTLSTPHMTGNDVRQWQQQMAHRGWGLSVDGDYGPRSHDVCVQFQREKGLNPDGVVGPNDLGCRLDDPYHLVIEPTDGWATCFGVRQNERHGDGRPRSRPPA
jgi:peptidoglycan hydrolase-like protein with peptidoglycan-binding domain